MMIIPVLTIAASDSSGAAGVQADLKTFEARGVYGMSAITAITAQNSLGIRSVKLIDPAFVAQQIQTVLEDTRVGAIKTGLLFNAEIIHVVADSITRRPTPKLVVDPVLVAGDGRRIVDDEAIRAYQTRLFPLATVITPNLLEAEILIGEKIGSVEEMKTAARRLGDQGLTNVLIKGGHLAVQGDLVDILLCDNVIYELHGETLPLKNPRGVGCTFASCIAAELAKGHPLEIAVATAREYITAALRGALEWKIGAGRGTIFHGTPAYAKDQVALVPQS